MIRFGFSRGSIKQIANTYLIDEWCDSGQGDISQLFGAVLKFAAGYDDYNSHREHVIHKPDCEVGVSRIYGSYSLT